MLQLSEVFQKRFAKYNIITFFPWKSENIYIYGFRKPVTLIIISMWAVTQQHSSSVDTHLNTLLEEPVFVDYSQ